MTVSRREAELWRHNEGMIRQHPPQPTSSSSDQVSEVPGGGAAVYEVEGRLLIRTCDGSDGLSIERDETIAIEDYPDVDADTLGCAVVAAADQALEVSRPSTWRKLSEYAAPLLAASPGKYRSYRAWQQVARYVHITRTAEAWTVTHFYPDLTSGSWLPDESENQSQSDSVQGRLPRDATPAEVGAMVLIALAELRHAARRER